MRVVLAIFIIFFISFYVHAVDNNDREIELIKSVSQIDEPKTKKDLLFLVSLVKDDTIRNKRLKDIASFKLKDIYIPNGVISDWKGNSLIVTKDIIEYVKSRTEIEILRWLLLEDEIVYESNTCNYRLRIYRSEIDNLKDLGIESINIDSLIEINKSAIEENGVSLEKVSLVKPFGFNEWIAVGMYLDEIGDRRQLAVLNKSQILFDQLKIKKERNEGLSQPNDIGKNQ